MDIEYKINRLYLFISTFFVITITYFTVITAAHDIQNKIAELMLCVGLLYAIVLLYSYRITITSDAIKNKIIFYPFCTKERACRFDEIERISYEFVIFDEFGNFKIYPRSEDKEKIIVISFLVDNKKEIIQKIVEKRPDLKLSSWIEERILKYKVIHSKFLVMSLIVIILLISVLIIQNVP